MQTNSADQSAVPRRDLRVACVDDDTLIRLGFASNMPGIDRVFVYDSLEPLLADPPQVDLVVLDLWLHAGADPRNTGPVLQGARAVEAVARLGYPVLVYTNERRRHVLAGCLAAGAQGVVHKSEPLEAVTSAIRTVAAGGGVVTAGLAGLAEAVERRGELPTLSPRQLEVLRGRARGESFKAIGARLFISPKTAEAYMGEVSKRFADFLQTHSPADLENYLGVGVGDLLDPDEGDIRAVG